MLDFAKWMATEHPFLSFFAIYLPCWAVNGLGRIGSTTVKVKQKDKSDD